MKKISLLFRAMGLALALPLLYIHNLTAQTIQVSFTVDPKAKLKDISPNIFGVNNGLDNKTHVSENVANRRLGGNRATGFNWETNASNAGEDYLNSSDDLFPNRFGLTGAAKNEAGKILSVFHQTSLDINQSSTLTVQTAGYVANDKNGSVTTAAPSSRWAQVFPTKGSAFSLTPNQTDSKVYMDEMVNFMVQKFGLSSTTKGVKNWSMDNEPDLWKNTHPFLHPNKTTCAELVSRTIDYSKAVKSIDPDGMVFGGVFSGWGGFMDLQGATDWNQVKGNYGYFCAYLLDQMKKESDKAGKRLMDVIDIHYYTEAQSPNGTTRMWFAGTGRDDAITRMQCTRSLWDSTYKEKSWITQYVVQNAPFLCLFPRIQKMIDTYNPGTKIAVTEYNFGGNNHISGGIAHADFLGLCAKYGIYQANIWSGSDGGSIDTYNSAAFKLYRNYDGVNSAFGNKLVSSKTSNVIAAPIYASIDEKDGSLHIVLINRDFDNAVNATLQIGTNNSEFSTGKTYSFNKDSPNIVAGTNVTVASNGSFSYNLPAQSVSHLVFASNSVLTNVEQENKYTAQVEAYPNPSTNTFQLSKPCNYTLYTLQGITLESGNCESAGCNVGENLDKGVFILKTDANGSSKTIRLVKK
jgi:mannan endo-1,4-beta-mannosidase